jgi:hypothetical protein
VPGAARLKPDKRLGARGTCRSIPVGTPGQSALPWPGEGLAAALVVGLLAGCRCLVVAFTSSLPTRLDTVQRTVMLEDIWKMK